MDATEAFETVLRRAISASAEAGRERALREDAERKLAALVNAAAINQESMAWLSTLLANIGGGSKIEAIRAYRALTGMPLKESKDEVEKYYVTRSAEAA